MCSDKLAARDGRTHRKLSREQRGAYDLRKLGGLAAAGTAKDLQTLTATPQRSTTADSRHCQRGQRHTRVKISVLVQLEIRYTDCRIHDVGDVLAAGDEDSRQ